MSRKVMRYTSLRESEVFLAPTRQRPGDAGLDLAISRYTQIFPGMNAHLATNIALEIAEGSFGLILPRSSTLWHKSLHVSPGIVDSGYRGEVMILVRNVSDRSVHLNAGDRVAQLLILPIPAVDFEWAAGLSEGSRGDAGFGSTGGWDGEAPKR